MRSIRKQLKFINIVLFVSLLVSLFYLAYNVLISENNYSFIYKLKTSIRNLDKQIALEREKNEELQRIYLKMNYDKNETIESFIRGYLFMVKPDEAIILKKED
jgi:cell division protein FtsB